MDEQLLDEIRQIRKEIHALNKNLFHIDELVNGRMGVVNELTQINANLGKFTQDINTRLQKVEDYILRQKTIVAFIATVFGIAGAALVKILAFIKI